MKAGEKRELTCISCPMGCLLTAEGLAGGTLSITGNRCPRGAVYAETEINDPRYTVTATCRTDSAKNPRLPVRTDAPCPRDRIDELLACIYALEVKLPVKTGDAVIEDFSGIRVTAARSLKN
jgi:CxxC motif-containing protein